MKQEEEDKVVIIPVEDRDPLIEEKVRYFMMTTPDIERNEKMRKRVVMPSFEDRYEQVLWENEEIRRCRDGHDGLSGKMYFWFHYVFIENIEKGKIAPEFRTADMAWFNDLDWATRSREWGLICVKRRRAGFSWKAAADALHDALFHRNFTVGMNSKTEKDSFALFDKVKFIYDNLPTFLRAKIGAANRNLLAFFRRAKDKNGNKITKGLRSKVFTVAPVDTAFEGQMLGKWICDESGKIPNLPQLWSYTEDCLMQEMRRIGVPILFGTAGDIGREGRGMIEMWTQADVHKLKRFFFAGWMGLAVDELGNDRKEDCIRWILYERRRREKLSSKLLNDFIQRYPLTPEEAFRQAEGEGIGDIVKINSQIATINSTPFPEVKGNFQMTSEGEVKFVPNPNGKVIIYEHPIKGLKNGYIAGCDPADHDDVLDTASDMSLHILKKMSGTDSPRIVLEYVDRPKKANDYYDQALMALLYYNDCKVLIEKNRYRMISYFDEKGFKYLMKGTPQGMNKLIGGRTTAIGIMMNKSVKDYLVSLVEEYIDDYCHEIPSIKLLQEFIDFGSVNTDRVMSFGMVLILNKDDKSRYKEIQESRRDKRLPSISYHKDLKGRIVRRKV